MNCQQANTLWDDARDRALPPADQVAFDQHLLNCPQCAAMWQRETLMLDTLAADTEPGDVQTFKFHVMRKMTEAETAPEPSGESATVDPVVRKFTPWAVVAAMAAAVALMISLWAVVEPADQPKSPAVPVAATAPTHPVSVLVQDLTRGIDQPQRLRESIEKTTSYLSLTQLAALLEREVAPAAPTETPNTRG
ncbi:zf-HC2 domain-containing protein [Planctomycetales bacterium ZRK34]|nr:zf-HC2 domain-containing protein [Planctomycetales bacterium ZRK34]